MVHDARTTPSSSPRPRASGGGGRAVAVAAVGGRAPRRRRGRDRAPVGRGVVGDGMSDAMTAQLQFRDLTLGYDRHPAVHHLDGEVPRGALMAVVGPNGAGKSTLFKGIVGVLPPLAGRIDLCGLKTRDIAYLPQAAELDRSFPINAYDLVAMGLWRRTGLFGGVGRRERDKIHYAIAAVGLTGFESRPIGTLSGGQRQRALLRRLPPHDARLG